MPRLVPTGTPSKTNRYVFPPGRFKLYGISLAVALGVAGVLAILLNRGYQYVGSPGPVASPHASFETKCATCHGPQVADVRCERCHDPFGSNRFQNAGHVWFGTKDPARVAKAEAVDCFRCHTEHRGREFSMAQVDSRRCAGCHFASFAKHPEFDLDKARSMNEESLSFSHRKHLKAVRKAKLERCQFCHEPTRDRSGFQPLNFDRHCGKCHLPRGSVGDTEPIPAVAVILPQQIDAPWARARGAVQPEKNGTVIVRNLVHADPWVIYNLARLLRGIDPEGFSRRRAALERRIAELSAQMREPPTRGFSLAKLRREETELTASLAALPKSSGGDGERRKLERALARVRVQIEIGPVVMTAPRLLDWRQIDAELSKNRAEFAELGMGTGGQAPLPPGEREAHLAAVNALAAPCAFCHIYNKGVMTPVRAAVPLLGRANFTHLPHLEQLACLDCHGRVIASGKARDVNLPGIATCRDCHRPPRTRSDCAGCHSYHPGTEPWPPI